MKFLNRLSAIKMFGNKAASVSGRTETFPAAKPGERARTVRPYLLFLLGLVLGMAVFFPRIHLWTFALKSVERAMGPGAGISWTEIKDAGLFRAKITGLSVTLNRYSLTAPEADVSLGISPLVSIRLKIPDLKFSLYITGAEIRGNIDLAAIDAGMDISGTVNVDVRLKKRKWSEWPSTGMLEAKGDQLTFPGGFALKKWALAGELNGSVLHVSSFETGGSLNGAASGVIRFNPSAPSSSDVRLNWTVR